MARFVTKVVIALVAIGFACGFALVTYVHSWQTRPQNLPQEAVIEFKGGTGLSALARKLSDAGVIDNSAFFTLMVRLGGEYKRYQAGTYRFTGQVTPLEVERTMVEGLIYSPVVAQITIPEGFKLREVIERLAAHGIGHIVEITNLSRERGFLDELKVRASTLEGYIYPATYSFHKLPTAREALTLMVRTFWQNLPPDYEEQAKSQGLNLNDAVTFASLIELETRLDEERPLVSEVIWRRLKDKAPLGIDAAIIYGIPDYTGDLTWANLSDRRNPYNTRIHRGLPPTAIGAPSRKSLEAVLNPSNFGYYYYVLTPGFMRHHFSKTLAEHNENVKKLVDASKRGKAHDTGKH